MEIGRVVFRDGRLFVDGVAVCPAHFEDSGSGFCDCAADIGWQRVAPVPAAVADAVARLDDGVATAGDRDLADRYDEQLQVAWDNWLAACDAEARRRAEGGAA